MNLIALFICAMFFNYYIYVDAKRREVKKEYKWVLLNFFIPFIGALIYLWRRPKLIVTTEYQKRPYGFRSKNKVKMAIATIGYVLLFSVNVLAGTLPPTDTNKPNVTVSNATSAPSNIKETETKSPDDSVKADTDTIQPT